jgi:hypothetical protein
MDGTDREAVVKGCKSTALATLLIERELASQTMALSPNQGEAIRVQ